jgi:hypothetical protein
MKKKEPEWPAQRMMMEMQEGSEEDELQLKYRQVLLSGIGREVLSDILAQCHFGCTLDPDNRAMIAEHNVGISILASCGILGPETRKDVVMALCNVTPARKDEE